MNQNLKRLWGIIIFLAIILLIAAGILIWRLSSNNAGPVTILSPGASTGERWEKGTKLFSSVTSTSTLKLSDSLFRMYLMKDGEIKYTDSTDAKTFGVFTSTGINADSGKVISNPSVLKIAEGNWILVYEQSPSLPQGSVKGPGLATERDLLLATSTDGKTFAKAGMAISSNNADDKFFASVPNLVKISDSSFRLYYVSQGDKIASATSVDGRTWKREAGFRLENRSVDPDVLLSIDGSTQHWVMYYSTLEGANNRIYKATSSDGLNWQKGEPVLRPSTSTGVVVDPDIVNLSDNKYRMFFGESSSGNAQMAGQGQIDLYYADENGKIF